MSIKLGSICSFQSGGTPAKGNADYFNGSIPWITTTALNGSQIDEKDAVDWITEKAINETAAKIVPAYSIMVGTRVGVGKVAVNTVDMSTSQDIISLLNIDEKTWSKDFLCKFLQGKSSYLNSQARGATIKGIKIDVLANLDVPNIDYERQQFISKTIDKVRLVINARRQELEKLDDLIKARFVEMFGDPVVNDRGWQKITLLESLEAGRTVTYGIVQTGDEFENGTPVFRPIDIASGHVPKREELKKTDPLISAQYKRTLLKGNELLITVRGSVGETFQTTDEFKGCNVGRNIVPLVADSNKVLQRFLQELFAQDAIKNWLKGITKGIALQGLNMGEFKEMPVIVPPIAMQRAFVVFAIIWASLKKCQ